MLLSIPSSPPPRQFPVRSLRRLAPARCLLARAFARAPSPCAWQAPPPKSPNHGERDRSGMEIGDLQDSGGMVRRPYVCRRASTWGRDWNDDQSKAPALSTPPPSPSFPDTYGRGHGGGAASPGELALLGPAGEPLFSARRSSILGGAGRGAVVELPDSELRVEGSFARRCCRVVARGGEDGEEETVVAEVRRKVDVGARVVMGRDVFVLRQRRRSRAERFLLRQRRRIRFRGAGSTDLSGAIWEQTERQ